MVIILNDTWHFVNGYLGVKTLTTRGPNTKCESSVTDCGVIEHLPDLGHWGLDSDLLFKGLRN